MKQKIAEIFRTVVGWRLTVDNQTTTFPIAHCAQKNVGARESITFHRHAHAKSPTRMAIMGELPPRIQSWILSALLADYALAISAAWNRCAAILGFMETVRRRTAARIVPDREASMAGRKTIE